MYHVDSRSNTYNSFYLPPQALPDKKKDKQWKEDCMNALEHIGLRYLNKYRYHFDKNYRIVEGDFRYSDITDSSLFLSEVEFWKSQAPIEDSIKHYGFVEPIIRQLVAEFQKQPDSVMVKTDDPLSTNDFIRTKTDMLWSSVSEDLNAEIDNKMMRLGIDPYRQDFSSEEEMQAHQQQVEQTRKSMTPPEIERYMSQDYKTVYMDWAEITLENDKTRFRMDEIDRDCMVDFLTTARCFRHHRVGYDYYLPERWSPKNTFTSCTPENRYVEDDEYVGRIHYFTPTEVINYFGYKLSEQEKRDITKSNYYSRTRFNRGTTSVITNTDQWIKQGGGTLAMLPFKSYLPYENSKYFQEVTGYDMGVPDMFPNNQQYGYDHHTHYDHDLRYDLIRVVEGYWVSQKRIGYLTLINEQGELQTEIVSDEILRDFIRDNGIKQIRTVSLDQHEMNPQANTIVWDYIPEVWYGVKICRENTDMEDDLYLDVSPIEYQLKGESQLYHVKLPVTGIVDRVSLVDVIYQRQVDYNMAMNFARDYMSKELGIFYLMDMSYLPQYIKDYGGEEVISKLMETIKELGILPVDGRVQNTKSQFNQFTSVNMDLTAGMVGKFQYAQLIKQEAYSMLGLTPERVGMPIEQETATGIQASLDVSYSQTDMIFDKFAKHQERTYEVHLNVAQYCQHFGKDNTLDYTDSDRIRHFRHISDPYLPLRRFRIYLQNNAKRRSELETLKQVFLQDNTVPKDLEMIADVISSDSISRVLQLGRLARRQAEIQQEKARMHELQTQQQELQAEAHEKQVQRDWDAEQNRLDREFQLNKQAILALGFADDKDVNNNQVADVLDAVRTATERLKVEAGIAHDKQSQADERLKDEREHNLKANEQRLKEREIEAKVHDSNIKLQVARENKYKHEVRGNKS